MGFYYAQILKEIRMDGNSMSLPEEAQKLYYRTTYVTKLMINTSISPRNVKSYSGGGIWYQGR